MKAKISAGAEIDFLTEKELRNALKDHQTSLTGGVEAKYKPFNSATLPVDLVVPIGYTWSLTAISAIFNLADKSLVYLNEHPTDLIAYDANSDTRHVMNFTSDGGMIKSGGKFSISGTGTAVSVAGLVLYREVLAGEEWRL